MILTSLPTLRSKIFRSFSLIIGLYGLLGVFLVGVILTSSQTTPKVIHVNYDSIAASYQMKEAWNALWNQKLYPQKSFNDWRDQFEKGLRYEEGNITEPGEREIAKQLRTEWDQVKMALIGQEVGKFQSIDELLTRLVSVNQMGMFSTAQENTHWSKIVLLISIAYFFLSLILSVFLADNLATRLSTPIKSIVEALHRRPEIGKKLKLVQPRSLELLILTTELERLWSKVTETEQLNVRELINQNTRLDAVLESVEDALLVVDNQGLVTHVNTFLLKLIGLSKDQVIGGRWNDLPTSNENYLHLRALFKEDMNDSHEIELFIGNGEKHQFSARMRRIAQAGKQPFGVLYLLHDITEKRQKEKFRADFIDLLSHEIKTPLQSLGTATELLSSQKDNLPGSMVGLVDTITEDVERIKAVANEFVQVTQSHSKLMKLKLQTVGLSQLLPEWIKPFRIIAKDRGVTLNVKQEGSEMIYANLDPVKFPWVISNLVSNAIRFSPAHGDVSILLTDRNGAVEIQVKDDGPGVPAGEERRIFEPFFQSPMTTSAGKKGLFGIGLTIAKEVVEAHDGRIEYFRRATQGSEFRIVLPFPPMDHR